MSNDKKHKKIVGKIVGFSMLAVGIICFVVGLVSIFNLSFTLVFLSPIGVGLAFTSLPVIVLSYRQDMINKNVQVSANALKMLKKELGAVEPQACPHCGAVNDGGKFCVECGKPLKKVCPTCGATLKANSKFCDQCGSEVQKNEP